MHGDNPVNAFDFPLRYRLKDLCQTYGFSLRQLTTTGTVLTDQAGSAVQCSWKTMMLFAMTQLSTTRC